MYCFYFFVFVDNNCKLYYNIAQNDERILRNMAIKFLKILTLCSLLLYGLKSDASHAITKLKQIKSALFFNVTFSMIQFFVKKIK